MQQDSALTKVCDGAGYFGDGAPEAIDGGDDHDIALSGISKQGVKARPVGIHRTREFVGEDLAGFDDAVVSECGQLRIEVLAGGAHPRVPEDRCHTTTVSLPADIEDLRHAV